MECSECAEVYDGEPPCDECNKPELFISNQLAWQVWQVCSQFERPAGFGGIVPIRALSAARLVEMYGGSLSDFEKVLHIENQMLPYYRDQAESKQSKKQNQNQPFEG